MEGPRLVRGSVWVWRMPPVPSPVMSGCSVADRTPGRDLRQVRSFWRVCLWAGKGVLEKPVPAFAVFQGPAAPNNQ